MAGLSRFSSPLFTLSLSQFSAELTSSLVKSFVELLASGVIQQGWKGTNSSQGTGSSQGTHLLGAGGLLSGQWKCHVTNCPFRQEHAHLFSPHRQHIRLMNGTEWVWTDGTYDGKHGDANKDNQ